MTPQTTPLESVPDLEPGIVEKLVAAGITTVETVADMTPEQLEEVPGIGPKTVEKISIAVNNYFSSLEAAEAGVTEEGALVESEAVAEGAEEAAAEADEDGVAAEEAMPAEAASEAEELEAAEDAEDASLAEEEASLVAAEAEGASDELGPGSAGQSGDSEGLSEEPEASSESVEELVEEGQYFEAEAVEGVENAPPADEAELTIRERPATENENVSDEEEPGEKRS